MADSPEPGSAAALANAHAQGQAIVHGAARVPSAAPALSEKEAPAGTYKLTAKVWNEVVSAPTEVLKRFVKHRRGAEVELDSPTAERLLRAGAVTPTTTEQAESAAAQAPTAMDKAVAINDAVGQQPISDPAAAAPGVPVSGAPAGS